MRFPEKSGKNGSAIVPVVAHDTLPNCFGSIIAGAWRVWRMGLSLLFLAGAASDEKPDTCSKDGDGGERCNIRSDTHVLYLSMRSQIFKRGVAQC